MAKQFFYLGGTIQKNWFLGICVEVAPPARVGMHKNSREVSRCVHTGGVLALRHPAKKSGRWPCHIKSRFVRASLFISNFSRSRCLQELLHLFTTSLHILNRWILIAGGENTHTPTTRPPLSPRSCGNLWVAVATTECR